MGLYYGPSREDTPLRGIGRLCSHELLKTRGLRIWSFVIVLGEASKITCCGCLLEIRGYGGVGLGWALDFC